MARKQQAPNMNRAKKNDIVDSNIKIQKEVIDQHHFQSVMYANQFDTKLAEKSSFFKLKLAKRPYYSSRKYLAIQRERKTKDERKMYNEVVKG